MSIKPLSEGIHCWSRLSPPHGYDFNGHLIEYGPGNIIVDPVPSDEVELSFLKSRGAKTIVITNRNHGRDANRLREELEAETLIHDDDARHARSQGLEIDGSLSIGQQVGPFEVLSAAGKSPGEILLYWRARRLAVIGDLVVGHPAGSLKLLPPEKLDDPARLRASVKSLLQLEIECLILGDGVSILGGAKEALKKLISTFPD